MSMRINSSDGILLHLVGRQHSRPVMSLSVSGGHVVLLLYGGKRKVTLRSQKKCNDGRWHTVRAHTGSQLVFIVIVTKTKIKDTVLVGRARGIINHLGEIKS